MAEGSEHERHAGEGGVPGPTGASALSAAVDDALADEVKRQRARFVQEILGVDRAEGVGRGEARWDEAHDRDHQPELGLEPPDDEAP